MTTSPMPDAVFLDPHNTADAAAWQHLWQRAENRTPFTHLAFVEAIAEATGRKAWLAAVEDGGRLTAGAVLFSSPRRPWLAAPAPLTRYTGVLLDPPIEEKHVAARQTALDVLLQHIGRRFLVAALTLAPDLTDARPFQWAGFACTPRYTYRLDAAAPYAPNRWMRRQLREGDVFTLHAADPGDATWLRLLDRQYDDRGQPPPLGAGAHRRLLDALGTGGLVEMHALRDPEGRLAGAVTALVDGRAAYLWTGGSVPGPAMGVLLHRVIDAARAQERAVDLVGANVASIAGFKAHFHADLTLHFHAAYHRNRLVRAVDALHPLV